MAYRLDGRDMPLLFDISAFTGGCLPAMPLRWFHYVLHLAGRQQRLYSAPAVATGFPLRYCFEESARRCTPYYLTVY